MNDRNSTQTPERAARFWRARVFGLLVALAACGLGIAFRSHWLPLLAYPLLPPGVGPGPDAVIIWIRSGDGHSFSPEEAIEEASKILRRNPQSHVIFTEGWPSRLVELGVIPPMVEVLRRALQEEGLSPDRVIKISPEGIGLWYEAQAIDRFLGTQHEARVVFFVEEFAGRSTATVLHAAMSPDAYRRISIVGIPRREFSCDNWWRSRAGVKGLMVGYLYLLYALIDPRPTPGLKPLPLAAFEELIPAAPTEIEQNAAP